MSIIPFYLDEAADELRALFVEAEFSARWTLLEAYHQAGGMILDLENNPENTLRKEELVLALSQKTGKSERTLWYAVKFRELFPDLQALPEGKNTSWNKVVTKYLTTPKDKEECAEHDLIVICSKCKEPISGYVIKKENE